LSRLLHTGFENDKERENRKKTERVAAALHYKEENRLKKKH
jgi:hypothetical protein